MQKGEQKIKMMHVIDHPYIQKPQHLKEDQESTLCIPASYFTLDIVFVTSVNIT